MKNAISPTRKEDYANWYQEVVKKAELAEHSKAKGCMIIKPWGYAIWENIQSALDKTIKEMGVQNVYFPLFIPLSFFEKEAAHVGGFATECAVVTHSKLEKDKDGKFIPTSKLDEPYVIRPTSEMIIGDSFSRWIESYRDLPLCINQWANIVRFEMRPRLFLRTTEFLWQEGHTAHETEEEAQKYALLMANKYFDFLKDFLAIFAYVGKKTETEKFPGAVDTFSLEAMMQDKKALQAITSHFLGQNFAKACNIKFQSAKGEEKYVYSTSWGASTRLIGALIMSHSDDDGLVLPPRISPFHIVVQPILHTEERDKIMLYARKLVEDLKNKEVFGAKIKVFLDLRDIRGGQKKWEWIKKGVPIRVEIGKKEIENNNVLFFERKNILKANNLKKEQFLEDIKSILENMQKELLKKNKKFRDENTFFIKNKEEFYSFFSKGSGFVCAFFHPNEKIEKEIKENYNATVRVILEEEKGDCIFTKQKANKVIFAKSY